MSLPLWLLIISVVVVAIVAVVVYSLWRRRQPEITMVCPRCATDFDPKVWKKRNAREHYHGRYTIVPVYVCPKCGYKMARVADELLK